MHRPRPARLFHSLQRVAGHEFKDFDVWVKAGGFQTAYVETVPVEVTNGQLDITFTPNIENPEINGIEITPRFMKPRPARSVKNIFRLLIVAFGSVLCCAAPDCSRPPLHLAADATNPPALTADQDHRHMMELLHITSLRPGRDGGNPKSSNYANYDESKANPYPDLPDPLVTKAGQKVTTPEMWWSVRRPEIVEDFDREIYGSASRRTRPPSLGKSSAHCTRTTARSPSSPNNSSVMWIVPPIPISPWISSSP